MEAETDRVEQQIRALRGEVDQSIEEFVAEYTSQHGHLRTIVPGLVWNARADRHESALPLLVHAAETGDPAPAVPVAALHALWWRAANVIDDVADGAQSALAQEIGPGATMMAAFNWAYVAPMHVVRRLTVPESVRQALLDEYFQACTSATEGQLADLLAKPGSSTPEEVLRTYRNKSSAPYEMACVVAATTAGASAERVRRWQDFGRSLGLLGQFRNDQEDLQSGRLEDFANGTSTYHLVSLLRASADPDHERLLALLDRADNDDAARQELLRRVLEPELVRSYLARIDEVGNEAEQTLLALGGARPFLARLRARVRSAAEPCELLAAAARRPAARRS